jgi:hypothetical protein
MTDNVQLQATAIPGIDLASLIAQITEAQTQFKAWETRKKALLDQLLAAHRDGHVPTKFDFALPGAVKPAKFSLQQGRKTIKYDPVIQAEIDLMQAKAVEDGKATVTYGASFWRIAEGG